MLYQKSPRPSGYNFIPLLPRKEKKKKKRKRLRKTLLVSTLTHVYLPPPHITQKDKHSHSFCSPCFFYVFSFCFPEIESYVVQTSLKLQSSCFSFPNAGITGMGHCAQQFLFLWPEVHIYLYISSIVLLIFVTLLANTFIYLSIWITSSLYLQNLSFHGQWGGFTVPGMCSLLWTGLRSRQTLAGSYLTGYYDSM